MDGQGLRGMDVTSIVMLCHVTQWYRNCFVLVWPTSLCE